MVNTSQENLLECGQSNYLSAWKRREESAWVKSIKRSVLVAMTISCLLRLVTQLLAEAATRSYVMMTVATAALGYCGFVIMTSKPFCLAEKLKMIFLLHFLQAYFLIVAILIHPESKELWALASTVIFCMYEIPSFHNRWLIAGMIGRQFLMWHVPGMVEGKSSRRPGLYVVSVLAASAIVLWFTHEIRRRASEHYRFCESIDAHENKINSILRAIPEGLAVVTESLDVASCNPLMQALLSPGTTRCEMAICINSMHCLEHVERSEIMTHSLLQQIESFIKHPNCSSETFGVTKIDEHFYEWKGTKCQWDDATACILTASNISSWVNSQNQLVAESNSKSALLRFVSHELRTPANAILNLASSVMEEKNLLPSQKHELSIIVTSTHFLSSVVNDLLDFTRMLADKFTLVKQDFNIRREIKQAVSLVEIQCVQRGLFLKVKTDEFVPEVIHSDPTRMKQILLNLLGNALKYTFHGGIRVICMMTDRNTVKITVKDTGIGIPKDKIDGLCLAFGTVEDTQRINPQGCGLGIYISNLLALSLGSRQLDIQSTLGKGSEFSFELAINQNDSVCDSGITDFTTEISEEREAESSILCPSFLGGKNDSSLNLPSILVVDDSDFNRLVLAKMLESFGLKSDEAVSGLRALSMINKNRSRGHFYRLILMDIEMAEMDGITATHEIRTMEHTGELAKRPRIVACSAHRGREDVEKCLIAGMDDYMDKPVNKARLEEVLKLYYEGNQ